MQQSNYHDVDDDDDSDDDDDDDIIIIFIDYIILLWTIINHINHKSYVIIITIITVIIDWYHLLLYLVILLSRWVEHFAGRRWLWAPCWALTEWSRIGSRRRPFRHRKWGIEPTTYRDIMGISTLL